MSDFATIQGTSVRDVSRVALRSAHVKFNFAKMRASQYARFADWKRRNEELASKRDYLLPRIHEMYARALITEPQRDALHVTRKVLEAVVQHSFLGSQGWVAQYSDVTNSIRASVYDEETTDPQTPGERSLRDCIQLLRSCAYNISEGPSFIRTPMALPRLEQKYYVEDLSNF